MAVVLGATRVVAQSPTTGQGQALELGSVAGTVSDAFDGVLPGVVVSALAADGRTLSTMVTGATGEFTFERLPAGNVDIAFRLDGFEEAKTRVTVEPGRVAARVIQQLALKGLSETVVVRADPPPPPPKPRPVLKPVAQHDPSAVCGPAKVEGIVTSTGTVLSQSAVEGRSLFGARDELAIESGANANFQIGDNFIVRRRYTTPLTDKKRRPVLGEHSAGLVQIVSVDESMATAVVVYSCDEVMSGDYLVRFELETPALTPALGAPQFDAAVRILFADAGQSMGLPNRMLVIDRGALEGVFTGQRFTLFRRSRLKGARPVVIGEAVVVSTRRESATIRVERATDVVFVGLNGDFAAPHRPQQRASQ